MTCACYVEQEQGRQSPHKARGILAYIEIRQMVDFECIGEHQNALSLTARAQKSVSDECTYSGVRPSCQPCGHPSPTEDV